MLDTIEKRLHSLSVVKKNTMPIMGTVKIKHKNTKDRKDFILDCVFIGVALNIFYISLNDDNYEDTNSFHKNRDRKLLSKLKNTYEKLNNKKLSLYSLLSHEDLKTILYKAKESGVSFINNIARSSASLNLQHLTVAILDAGLERKRKSTFYKILEPFRDYDIIISQLHDVVDNGGIPIDEEIELASAFVKDVRY